MDIEKYQNHETSYLLNEILHNLPLFLFWNTPKKNLKYPGSTTSFLWYKANFCIGSSNINDKFRPKEEEFHWAITSCEVIVISSCFGEYMKELTIQKNSMQTLFPLLPEINLTTQTCYLYERGDNSILRRKPDMFR